MPYGNKGEYNGAAQAESMPLSAQFPIAGGLSGWVLTAIGYDELASVQTDAVKDAIYSVSTFFPGAVFILCALALAFIYPLSKKRVESNVAELKRRHGEA